MSNRINELLSELRTEIESIEQTQDDDESPLDNPSVVDQIPHDYTRDDGPEIPLLLARDGVKSSRSGKTLQIPLYDLSHQIFISGRKELKLSIEGDVSLMDVNEAILLAGLSNLDDAYRVLERWGYGVDRGL